MFDIGNRIIREQRETTFSIFTDTNFLKKSKLDKPILV